MIPLCRQQATMINVDHQLDLMGSTLEIKKHTLRLFYFQNVIRSSLRIKTQKGRDTESVKYLLLLKLFI